MQSINPLKKINLEQYQKPKTLIVVHYKGKRISVPLLGDCKNLTQMLYQHIDKFQQTVLKNDPKWEVLSGKKIVCFNSSSSQGEKTHKQSHNSVKKCLQKFLKYSDGDLKIDLLLSLIRIQNNSVNSQLDITKYYKYMEIQPYSVEYPTNKLSQSLNMHKYYFYRQTQKSRIKNVYLARSLENGYFYSIKVYRSGLSLAEHQVRFLSTINKEMEEKFPSYMKNQYFSQLSSHQMQESVVPKTEIYMIPSEEQEDESQELSQNQGYKHLAIAVRYNLKGKLSEKMNDKNSKMTERDLLKYLKQLVWITYALHEDYNIIHRNLTPQSFQIDEVGDLRLMTFSSWVECYKQDGTLKKYPEHEDSNRSSFDTSSRIYEEQFQFPSDNWYHIGHYTPPQVLNHSKQGYNKYVDYYTIGVVIKQIYEKVYEFQNKSQSHSTKLKLIQKMINGLTSNSFKEREQIALEIVEGIKKSKEEETQRKSKQVLLNLSQIRLGQMITIENSERCVQNEDNDLYFNGISHLEIVNYFKPVKDEKESIYEENGSHYQAKKQVSREKKKGSNIMKVSRGQTSNISNSRDKSVKSAKSSKSKDKNRVKSKVSNQKGDKVDKKSKSKSHKKIILSPQKDTLSNLHVQASSTHNTQKVVRTNFLHQNESIAQPKSKSKSCNKLKNISNQKSPNKKSKEIKQKMNSTGIDLHQDRKMVLNRTLPSVPLPKPSYKSPAGRNA